MTRKERAKKVITMVIAMSLLIFGIIGIDALQWHTQSKEATFSVANHNFKLVNELVEQDTYAPGDVVSHSVAIKNTGSGSLYVRIKAVFESSDIDNVCTLDINTTDYVYEDGFYYLTSSLPAGETSPALFNTITIASDATLEEGFEPDMIIYAEVVSIGTSNNYREAWELGALGDDLDNGEEY
jgi:hypothetical protein